MLDEGQQKLVLTQFNDTAHPAPPTGTLPELLLAQLDQHSDETAVVAEGGLLSFAELVSASRVLANRLRRLGLRRQEPVGLFCQPALDLMVGVWGVLFAGGAYLPLSPEYPEERLRYMIADSGLRTILTQSDLAARLVELSPPGTNVVVLDAPDPTPEAAPNPTQLIDAPDQTPSHASAKDSTVATHPTGAAELTDGPEPTDLAYVIYTSGSTGKPKGVLIEHRNVVNQLDWMSEVAGIGPGRVVAQKTPLSFDAAQWEVLANAMGARVALAAAGIYRDPVRLIEFVRQFQVTSLQCVPTLLQALLGHDEFAGCLSLRQVFSGGEALSRKLADACLQTLPGIELTNLYGPTECTINSTAFLVDGESLRHGLQAVSIGRPVFNTRLYILDGQRSPVAVGEVGEIYLGGAQVARGYLNRPELTAERFLPDPFGDPAAGDRLYRTGDLGHFDADGTVHFTGRVDNQVKLRGFRVELDEIRVAIESHTWVRNAAVVLHDDARTGFQSLVSFIELNPREAALMDQGNAGAHHQSKASRLQVRAQLANLGTREPDELRGRQAFPLPGEPATAEQRRRAFARKTFRFYQGGDTDRGQLLRLLGMLAHPRPGLIGPPDGAVHQLGMTELGALLRNFGPFRSEERLLPKYAYASPGSLYATQLHLELHGVAGLPSGVYYHHPVRHELVLLTPLPAAEQPRILLHLLGKRRAIEPVYSHNISEVLQLETGHLLGLFDEVLPPYGLGVREVGLLDDVRQRLHCAEDDEYLGTFELAAGPGPDWTTGLGIYLQAHPGRIADLPAGQYRYRDGRLEPVSDQLILRRHVIAINQQVYDRASFGISVVSEQVPAWLRYVRLGRALQRLQSNSLNLGLMSSGYSSDSGHDLPSARRLNDILAGLGAETGPSYFFVGGRVSDEQVRSEGMGEDIVHMQGPAEMIRQDLATALPDYMLPNRVLVLDELPLTANGKVDTAALTVLAGERESLERRTVIAPRTAIEQTVRDLWASELKQQEVSVQDNFFDVGGNSLIAVALINRINRVTGAGLPLQAIFERPTIESLAAGVDAGSAPMSRLVRLQGQTGARPIFCWPGLGGFTMNLRLLAERAGSDRVFYGVQAHGINTGEVPYPTIGQMAAADLEAIRQVQPHGPYELWGYSFGARVAFETAYQLEQAGEQVGNLVLIAPGSPRVGHDTPARAADFADPTYVSILYSVFASSVTGPDLAECLRVSTDADRFTDFVGQRFPGLDESLIRRIVAVVAQTYALGYTGEELRNRRLQVPVTVLPARGDTPSFLAEGGWHSDRVTTLELAADHYSTLRDPAVDELVAAIRRRTHTPSEAVMPHVNIKHFPVPLSEEEQGRLVSALTAVVQNAFHCEEGVISIALEPVEREVWHEKVYVPEIVNRKQLLHKAPNY